MGKNSLGTAAGQTSDTGTGSATFVSAAASTPVAAISDSHASAGCPAGGTSFQPLFQRRPVARTHILDTIGEYVYPAPDLAAKQYFIKIIRAGQHDYWLAFLRENTKTPLNHRSDSPKRAISSVHKTQYTPRLSAEKNFTEYEIVKRDKRSPQYVPNIKQGHKSQALSYVDEEKGCLPPPFQFNRANNMPVVGVRIATENVLLNRILQYDRGTFSRPYDAGTESEAYQKLASLPFLSSLDELAEKTASTQKMNEVLARVLAIDAIIIAKDNIESRLLAQVRLDLLNGRLRIIEKHFALDPMTLGERKIIFYLPRSELHNTEYTAAEQVADREAWSKTYNDYVEKYKSKKNKYLNTSGISAIHKAAALGKNEKFTASIAAEELNATDSLGRSALHFAAMNGQGDTLLLLLSQEEISVTKDDKQDDFLKACLTNKRPDYAKKSLLTLTELRPKELAALLDKGLSVGYVLSTLKLSPAEKEYRGIIQALADAFSHSNPATQRYIALKSKSAVLLEMYLTDETVSIENPSLLLFKSIAWGSAKSHTMLIEKGAQNHTGIEGVTTLHRAAKFGCALVVTTLLEQGADVNTVGKKGFTALYYAALYGHAATVVAMLLEQGADVNAPNLSGYTALHAAASCGHAAVVKALLEQGADVNTVGKKGFTALHFAAFGGHAAVVTALLSSDVDFSAETFWGQTALHIAAQHDHAAVVKALLDAADVNTVDKEGFTALHIAASGGHAAVVRALLDAADVNTVDKEGFTALHLAARHGHADVVTALLSSGATVDAKNNKGETALRIAAKRGHIDVVTALLDAGADVNVAGFSGWTALHYAALHGHADVVTALLENDATVDAKNTKGETALHFSAEEGHATVVTALLSSGATVDAKNNDGATALWLAGYQKHPSIVKRLVEHPLKLKRAKWRKISPGANGAKLPSNQDCLKTPLLRKISPGANGAELPLNQDCLKTPLFWQFFESIDELKVACDLYQTHLSKEYKKYSEASQFNFSNFFNNRHIIGLRDGKRTIEQLQNLLGDKQNDPDSLKKLNSSTHPVVKQIAARADEKRTIEQLQNLLGDKQNDPDSLKTLNSSTHPVVKQIAARALEIVSPPSGQLVPPSP